MTAPTAPTTPSFPLPQIDLSEGKVLPDARDSAYSLVEIFSSCEGEGAQCGVPMTFVRFSKCNLACSFCDTPYDRVAFKASEITLADLILEHKPAWIKFTGGEPTLQLRASLINTIKASDPSVKFCMETNGMLWSDAIPLLDYIVISPKRLRSEGVEIPKEKWLHPEWMLLTRTWVPDELRFIVTSSSDDWFEEHPLFSYANHIVFSPVFHGIDLPEWHQSGMGHPGCKGTVDQVSLNQCLRLVDKYKKRARLSIQMHKIIGAR